MDLLLPVFQLIYFVVHFLYSLGQAVYDCFHELYFLLIGIFWKKKHFNPDLKQLLEDSTRLKKLPRHMGFICMAKQTNNLKQVCHIINWCIGFGIHNVSLYDVDGLFKLKLPSLLDNIRFRCLDVTVRIIVDGQVYITECKNNLNDHDKNLIDYNSRRNIYHNSNYRNNITNILSLNVLSIEDGKEDIIRIAKKLTETHNKTLDMNYINSNLVTSDQFDPDLVIVVGRPICTLGFLPWQIRLTEFLNIPSISRLDYYEFRKLLQVYSKCEQRFGS